jgi:hypothetical protein
MMNHLMIDLETFGIRPGSAIRSIGAAMFDPRTDEVGSTFYKKISAMSCWSAGMTVDQSTVDWWNAPERKAISDELKTDAVDLRSVVALFHNWCIGNRAKYIWCQGGGFDEPLWSAAARLVGPAPPWKFWDCRCTRTAYEMSGLNVRTVPRDGTHHNALDDSLHQIKCVQASFKLLTISNVEVNKL